MPHTVENWFQQEQEENRIILQKFWQMRVQEPNYDENSIKNIKDMFLISLPPNGMSREEWENKLNKAWLDHSTFENFETFWNFFSHVPSLKAVGIAENLIQARQAIEVIKIPEDNLKALQQYTQDKKLSVSVLLGSVKYNNIESFCSENKKTSDLFSMHSIGKVFTGLLALQLLREQIINKEDFEKNMIQLNESVLKFLSTHAPKVHERLKEVTLKQTLTHHAGLGVGRGVPTGDYLDAYGKKIENTIEMNLTPTTLEIEDLLQFIPNQVSAIDEYHYSNTGMLLGGLSLQYLYNKHRKEHPEKKLEPLDFNGLIKKYIKEPSRMTFLQSNPPHNFKYNEDHKASKFIIGGPAGGSFTTPEDLAKFGKWIYEECQKSSPPELGLADLIEKHGKEFFHDNIIEHSGDAPSGSAYFLLNLKTGNIIIVFNDQRALAASEVGRAIQENIFSKELSSPAKIAKDLGITPSSPSLHRENQQDKNMQNLEKLDESKKEITISKELPDSELTDNTVVMLPKSPGFKK